MSAPKGPGRPPLGRSVRLGSVRMTEATAAQWEALVRRQVFWTFLAPGVVIVAPVIYNSGAPGETGTHQRSTP